MNTLTFHDLQFALLRAPRALLSVMKRPEWNGKVFVGGGFLRSIVTRDEINDVDVFVGSKAEADELARDIIRMPLESWNRPRDRKEAGVFITDNAITLTAKEPKIQIIHRWVFKVGQDVADSFDFTCCCAVFWWDDQWRSYCDERFYPDVAAKRLVYRSPVRNEEAGGSALRLLKYYRKGYCAPIDSFAAVIARLIKDIEIVGDDKIGTLITEVELTRIITGLLREVDPAIDPTHVAHLPAEDIGKAY